MLPDAPAAPWVDPQPGVPAGRVDERSYPRRFYNDVGGREDVRPGGVVFKEASRRFRDVLTRKGYDIVFEEVPGGEHEFIHWRGTFGNGLIALTKDWAAR